MSQPIERTQKVLDAIKAKVDNSSAAFRAGDISQQLRDGGFPLGTWEVRGELSTLADMGLVQLDADTATWSLTDAGVSEQKLRKPVDPAA